MIKENFLQEIAASTIVYIEDDKNVREYIMEFLKRYCKNVHEAGSAEDGLELYNRVNPEIMIVDINLPGISGLELISKIRQNDKDTRILVSTAYTNKEFMVEAIELALTRYLVKPITSKDLLGALKKCLSEYSEISSGLSNIDLGENCYYNYRTKSFIKDGEELDLRRKERQILEFFIEKNDEIISYETLESEIWQDDIMTENSIRSQIRNIRKRTHPNILKNVSGIGYKLYKSEGE